MEQLREYISDEKLTFGTAIDESGAEQLALTLVVSRNVRSPIQTNAEAALEHSRSGLAPALAEGSFIEDAATPRPAPRFIAPAPETTQAKARELLERQPGSRLRKGAVKWKQEMLQLEIVSRGRFEKSEPTIHRGADLDVPTYIRRGVPLN
jgi:cell division protein FtsZ